MAQLTQIAPYELGTWFIGTQSLEGLQHAVNLRRLEIDGFWSALPYVFFLAAALSARRIEAVARFYEALAPAGPD